jgi:hypothetical protein
MRRLKSKGFEVGFPPSIVKRYNMITSRPWRKPNGEKGIFMTKERKASFPKSLK